MNSKLTFLIILSLSATVFALQQQQKPGNEKVGLAAALADDEKVFGETPKVQSELRPIAEAVDRVYDKAIATAQKKADDVANQMTAQNQNRLAPEWEKAMQLVGLAKFNAANNKHTVAMSIDKADPK